VYAFNPVYVYTQSTIDHSASEMTYIVSGGTLNSTHSLTIDYDSLVGNPVRFRNSISQFMDMPPCVTRFFTHE